MGEGWVRAGAAGARVEDGCWGAVYDGEGGRSLRGRCCRSVGVSACFSELGDLGLLTSDDAQQAILDSNCQC